MLELETVVARPGGFSRRAFLQAGFLGIGSLTLANLLKLQAKGAAKTVQSDTAVILLWCGGGQSQLETYDMKPDAPSEIRGPMNAIKSNVPGIDVCELLPHHAQVAEKFSLIRSVNHGHSGHPDGTFRFTSGFGQDKVGGMLSSESKHPCITAVVNRALGITRNGMPVSLDLSSGYRWYGSPGHWGEMFRVPVASRGLENWRLQVKPGQLEDRRSLLTQFDRLRTDLDHSGNLKAMGYFQQQATEIGVRKIEGFALGLVEHLLVARRGEQDVLRGLGQPVVQNQAAEIVQQSGDEHTLRMQYVIALGQQAGDKAAVNTVAPEGVHVDELARQLGERTHRGNGDDQVV